MRKTNTQSLLSTNRFHLSNFYCPEYKLLTLRPGVTSKLVNGRIIRH